MKFLREMLEPRPFKMLSKDEVATLLAKKETELMKEINQGLSTFATSTKKTILYLKREIEWKERGK